MMTMSKTMRMRSPELPLNSEIDVLVHLVIVTTPPWTQGVVEVMVEAEVGVSEVL
jgi:hypothetical protein